MLAAQEKVDFYQTKLQEAMHRLQVAKDELETAQKELEIAQRSPFDVTTQLKAQTFLSLKSGTIDVSGPDFEKFAIDGQTYCIGTCDLPRELFYSAPCLDLSFMIPTVFNQPGPNILAKVRSFLSGRLEDIKKYNFFYFPVDTVKKQQGAKRIDLPNVCFAVTLWMLENGVEFIVADPLHKGTDLTVRIINYSEVYRKLVESRCKVRTGFSTIRGLSVVFYQRGTGNPDQKTYDAIERACSMTRDQVVHCHLTTGKYEKSYGEDCYRNFQKSVALLLHQSSLIDPYSRAKKENYLHNLFFVLDEFSAYAGYTAVAILGYGVKDVSTILAYRQGVYTPMKC